MTKDGVRDFMAAEYTLSENYVHGLAAFGPRLKKFRKPAFLPGLKPRASCGKFCESLAGRWLRCAWAVLMRESGF